jgi:hypothetical protein
MVEQRYCHDVRVLKSNIGDMLLFTESAEDSNGVVEVKYIWVSRHTVAVAPLLIWMVIFSDCINTWLQ